MTKLLETDHLPSDFILPNHYTNDISEMLLSISRTYQKIDWIASRIAEHNKENYGNNVHEADHGGNGEFKDMPNWYGKNGCQMMLLRPSS
jgi:hypothetical protein